MVRPESRSMRSVWIEIGNPAPRCGHDAGHAPCGACGLKFLRIDRAELQQVVTLHVKVLQSLGSRSMRSVWIEIGWMSGTRMHPSSRSMRSVWIEISEPLQLRPAPPGHAPCGACGLKSAWRSLTCARATVTLHAERVD